jgi:hypothetical protein
VGTADRLPSKNCPPRCPRCRIGGVRENSAGGRNHYGGTRRMAEQHSLARLEAYRLGTRSVKIGMNRWGRPRASGSAAGA